MICFNGQLDISVSWTVRYALFVLFAVTSASVAVNLDSPIACWPCIFRLCNLMKLCSKYLLHLRHLFLTPAI